MRLELGGVDEDDKGTVLIGGDEKSKCLVARGSW